MTQIPGQVQKVVIAGGGTAGWMAAAALAKLMGKVLDITLIESDEIGTVGVGEATIPALVFFHKLLGINEQEFLQATQGTYKLGIQFENWRQLNHTYLHAFGMTGQDCWACGFQHFWLRGRELGFSEDFGQYCLERQAAEANKFAHLPNNGLNYAFHFDASLYAKFLRKLAETHGARRIEGKIASVQTRAENGFIEAITLEGGQQIAGDLFLDCTGFRGLLIEQTLHTGYEDWSHWLPCDRAVAVQTESVEPAIPYTRSIAREAGWQWRIPLQHRVGNGMVFCSKYVSEDEASQQLMRQVEGKPLIDPRVIRFKAGRRLKQWNRNCIALGLASGFLEPLESTSIHLIQQGVVRLLRMFPRNGVLQSDIDEYNKQTDFDVEHIRDFIILHYKATERDDTPFWRYCRDMDVPASLAHRMQLFRETGRMFRDGNELFDDSWMQVMIGQGLMPQSYHPLVDTMSTAELQQFLTQIRQRISQTVASLPTHANYVARYSSGHS